MTMLLSSSGVFFLLGANQPIAHTWASQEEKRMAGKEKKDTDKTREATVVTASPTYKPADEMRDSAYIDKLLRSRKTFDVSLLRKKKEVSQFLFRAIARWKEKKEADEEEEFIHTRKASAIADFKPADDEEEDSAKIFRARKKFEVSLREREREEKRGEGGRGGWEEGGREARRQGGDAFV